MFKKSHFVLATLICLFFTLKIEAQTNWNFAAPTDGAGSSTVETGKGICTDASGNIYVAGVFNGASDFDLNSASTSIFTSSGNDGYIASYDKNGNFRWKTIVSGTGSDFPFYLTGVATNGTYIWVAGSANLPGSPSISSSTNTVTITSGTGLPASTDALVAKMNCSNGAVQWVTTFGGSTANDAAMGIAIDPSGCSYVIGTYSGAFTIGSVSAPAVGGSSDLYVAKLTPSGSLIHFSGGGTTGTEMQGNGGGICYVPGATPAIVAVGSFNYGTGTGTFGSQTVTNSGNAANNDDLLLELDTTLVFTNAIGMGNGTANNGEELYGAVYDAASGGVFVSGYFNTGTITVPGVGTLTSNGGEDIFIGRYSIASNNFTWAKNAGGTTNDRCYGIASDGQGGLLIGGSTTSNPCNFGGSVSVNGSAGANDIFAAKYNTSGTALWAVVAGGTGGDDGRAISSYVETTPSFVQNVYLTGNFQNTVTFNTTTLVADGASNNDFFLARINDLSLPLQASQSQTNLTCNGVCNGSASVVASGGTSPYTYSWAPSGGSGAASSSLCAGNYTCTITDAASTSITKTFTVTQPSALSLTSASQTNVSCNGGSNGAASVNAATGGAGGYTYNWTPGNPSGDGTTSVTGLTAGNWTCTVTDANSCTTTRTFTITQPSALSLTTASQTNISCNGGSNGAASVNVATGGAGGYTYNWTPGNPSGDGTTSVTGLTAGNWTCTVTDANSCTTSTTFTVTQPTTLSLTTLSQTNVSCNGGSNGAASVNAATGGAGGYTYNWTPGNPSGDGTTSVTGLTAGNWTCTVTDANSCTTTKTFTVTQPSALSLTQASQTNISCNGGSNGAASVNTATGGAGGYTYNWTPGNPSGDGTISVTGLTAGNWTCTVTDANSCTSATTFTVTQPSALSLTTASQTNISCNGGSNGAASVNAATGGAGGFTYNWTPGNPSGDGTVSVTGLTAGNWSCTVTDANSCTTTTTFTITQPSALSLTQASQTNISCNGGSNGAASVNVATGGAGGYTYNWTPGNPSGDGTVSVTGLTAGNWTCTVTDANSCATAATFTVTQPAVITANISSTTTSCSGSTGTASVTSVAGGTGSYTYSWSPSGGSSASASSLGAGNYTCTITDGNSCVLTKTVTVSTASGPSLSTLSQTNVSCNGGSNGVATVNTATGGSGGYTYNWTPGNPSGDGTTSVTGLTSGNWTCTVTDGNGCSANQVFNITQPSALSLTTASQTNISCNGGSNGAASVNAATGGAGGYTYNWTPGNPSGDGTISVTGLTAGNWTCTVTDANACTSATTFTVTQPSTLSLTTASQTNISCNGGSNGAASVNVATGGAGGYTYNWTPGNPSGDGTTSVTGLTAGNWTCTVTDANSCTTTRTFTVTQPSALSLTIASQTNISCNGGSNGAASVNAATGGAGGYTYNWTPGNPSGDGTTSVTGLTAGNWTCTVTDANSCTTTRTFTVTQPSALSLTTASQTNISCNGGLNGAASVNAATGGAGSYTYNWTPGNPSGDGTTSVTGLTAGNWTCTVTDANSCTTSQTFTVTQPSVLTLTTASQTNISCNGGNNGAASVNAATGGAGSYTYNWTPGNPSGDGTTSVTGLNAGNWTCTVTDANACSTTQVFTLTEPSAILISTLSKTDVLCNGGNNGAASLLVSGGSPNYSYDWAPGNPAGDGTASITGITAGIWTCTVTDLNSCASSYTISISEPPVLALTAQSQINVSCNGLSDGFASVNTATGGVGSYTYDWAPGNPVGDGTAMATGLSAGNWICTVTDANNCTASQNFTITEPNAITSNITSQTNVLCNGTSTGAASISASGGTGSLSYSWSPSGGSLASASSLAAGSYTCTITDVNNCAIGQSVTITESAAITGSQTVTLCAGQSITVGTSTYSATGTYNDVLTAVNGCDSTVTTNLTVGSTIASSQTVTLCAGQTLTVGANTYTASGIYTDVFSAQNGCDSTVTTNLTIDNAIDVSVGVAGAVITANATGATYQWVDCNNANAIIPGETNQTFTATANGDYAVIVTVNACSDTSACTNINTMGVSHVSNLMSQISLYPNPTTENVAIFLPNTAQINIYNSIGELIFSDTMKQGYSELKLSNQNPGVYFIKVVIGNHSITNKIIKL